MRLFLVDEKIKIKKTDLEQKLKEAGFNISSFSEDELMDFHPEDEMKRSNLGEQYY